MSWVVYTLRDAAGDVLYVGMTADLPRRLSEHRRKSWGNRIASTQTVECLTANAARRIESTLIEDLRPKHNRVLPAVISPRKAGRSSTLLLVEHRLGEPLGQYVAALRGEGQSWRRIAAALSAATSVDVTPEIVRIQFHDLPKDDAITRDAVAS